MKVLIVVVVLCAVVNSDEYGRSRQMPEYLRVKRAKYYSSPSRFYRKPPPPFLTKGAFSYTPPPNYMESEDQHPGSFRPKVSTSKRPVNDGLGDDDINNLVKHLSKQDLDRIIEFAGEKYGNPIEKYSTSLNKVKEKDDVRIYKVAAQETDQDHRFALNSLYIGNNEHTGYEMEYNSISKRPADSDKYLNNADQFQFNGPYANVNDAKLQNTPQFYPSPEIKYQELTNTPLDTPESMRSGQFTMLDAYIQKELNGAASENVIGAFTDSQATQEEQLPKPVNLREDHYEASNTDNVPVVKPNSYKLENFGNLPLMDYSSKRDTVSSYHVPHYSVVSPPNNPPPSSASASSYGLSSIIKTPPIEPAPPVSAAKEQSDAHLKAIKIWTHRSKGAAYTLHDDGSLSVETPRPKPAYGYS